MKKKPAASKKKMESKHTWHFRLVLALLGFVLYIQTIGFEFTLDDDIFYVKHESVQKGFAGIPEVFSYGSMNQFDGTIGIQPYRPITLLSFIFDKVFTDNNPAASHFINIVIYIILIQLLFTLFLKLFKNVHPHFLFFSALLFLVHPLHTEVVSSIKSRDELLAALFGILAWISFLPKNEESDIFINLRHLKASLFLCLSMMAKENGIVFAILIPLSYWMISNNKIKPTIIKSIPFLLTVLFFLFCRHFAMYNGEGTPHTMKIPVLDNVLAASKDQFELMATKMEILLMYIKLMFVPWPLSWDYSYNQIPLNTWHQIWPWLSCIIHGLLIILMAHNFKKNPIIAFGILFYLIACLPTNNLLIMNGASLAERFMFVPSIAFAMTIPVTLAQLFKVDIENFHSPQIRNYKIVFYGIVILFALMTMLRCADWKNNFTLFESGAKNAPFSSRTNAALGSEYMNLAEKETSSELKEEYIQNAIFYYKKSIEIYPYNSDASYKVGLIFSMIGDTNNAIKYYKLSLQATPQQIYALNNLGSLYASQKQYDSAFIYFKRSYNADSTNEMTISNLQVVSLLKKDYDQSIYFGNKALQLKMIKPKVYQLLYNAWLNKGDIIMSKKYQDLLNSVIKK